MSSCRYIAHFVVALLFLAAAYLTAADAALDPKAQEPQHGDEAVALEVERTLSSPEESEQQAEATESHRLDIASDEAVALEVERTPSSPEESARQAEATESHRLDIASRAKSKKTTRRTGKARKALRASLILLEVAFYAFLAYFAYAQIQCHYSTNADLAEASYCRTAPPHEVVPTNASHLAAFGSFVQGGYAFLDFFEHKAISLGCPVAGVSPLPPQKHHPSVAVKLKQEATCAEVITTAVSAPFIGTNSA
ncbi:hypothetical protein BESB_013140 [Besnoitia besnoiti]|uniref:Transmembrane protein n=1 Tax=Besnoitia besnoiti TaxID=94643 RepID=A0A2A9MBD1_BESBE|nr:hypothetical protein BESB_013140 [Besnoitia besnoiti]PFH32702.1 hypothetical protein BESB_013140 [Besnoitia besnoiti]